MGSTVGETVGGEDGFVVGDGVGFPATYVGTSVGLAEGDDEGMFEGWGVGLPETYVGTGVGDPSAKVGNNVGGPVGTLDGDAVGRYVGLRAT